MFWHATAVPKLQMPVFPVNPRLAKVGIAAVEPIDDVEHQRGRFGPDLRLAYFWGIRGERVKGSFQPLFPRVPKEYDILSISLRQGGPIAPSTPQNGDPALACSALVSL